MVDLPLDEREFKTLMEAVAYALVSAGSTYAVPLREMQRFVMQALCDDDVLGYPTAESHRMAKAAMRMAEDEFGLLVPQGADHVGFVHRVLLDHLAGRRLAGMAPAEQERVFEERLTDPAWLDVLLASLTAQSNPHTVADLLDKMSTPDRERQLAVHGVPDRVSHRLAAHALAAEVALPPRKATTYIDELVREVETSPTVEHRVNVVSASGSGVCQPVGAPQTRSDLHSLARRHSTLSSACRLALRDLAVPDDSAAAVLLHAMRMKSGEVGGNAAHAYARRFGSPKPDLATDAPILPADPRVPQHAGQNPDPRVREPLIRLVLERPTVKTQATALLAMAIGWPDEETTREHLDWGRRQGRTHSASRRCTSS